MKVYFIILLSLGLCHVSCLAQSRDQYDNSRYSLSHYTDENGLPQNSVKCIASDQDGFIWLATENGLVRFDGRHFYTFDKSNSNLSGTRFYGIQPDLSGNAGRLYAFISDREAMRIEKAVAISDSAYYRDFLSRIPHMDEDGARRLIASGFNDYTFDAVNLPRYYIIMVPSRRGAFFVVGGGKIEFFENWKKRRALPYQSTDNKNFFGLKGNLYRFSEKGAIFRVGPAKTDTIKIKGDILNDPAYIPGKRNFKTYWNNVSDQAFILLNKNFYYLDPTSEGTWTTRLILEGFDFEANNIRTVHFDTLRKRVFLGSITNGLYVFTKKTFRTLQFGDADNDNIFYAQTIYTDHSVLTPAGKVLGFSDTAGINPPGLYRQLLQSVKVDHNNDARSILTDAHGYIWSKSGDFLYRYSSKGGKLLNSWNMKDEVKTIYEGKDGRIWVGLKNKGLYCINHPGTEPMEPKAFSGPSGIGISYILQANEIELWVAAERGLYRVDLRTCKISLLAGTENFFVRSLYISPSYPEGLFLTTYEEGVLLYTGTKLVQFPMDPRKYLATAHCIVEGRKGFFWIPTNKGLFQVSKRDLIRYAQDSGKDHTKREKLFYMYYAKESGFVTNEFNGGCQPCAVTLPSGYVSLPSLNGLVWFKPENVGGEFPDKNFVIDRLEVQGRTRMITNDTVWLQQDPQQINFHVTTPYFGNENNLHMSYVISSPDKKPQQSDWISLRASDPVIRFSELGYGSYVLTVRKMNGFGRNNYMTRSVMITVPMHWYETIWFRLLFVTVLAGAVFSYTRFRVKYLQRKNYELELSVHLRTQKLERTLVALRRSERELNRQMHIRTRLIASISHDIRTPMRFLASSAQRVEALIDKGDHDRATEISKDIAVSAGHMNQLLENMIGYIKTQLYNEHAKSKEILLRSLIKEKADLFAPVIRQQSNRFVNDVRNRLQVNSNPQLLGILIHNLIDNANKYTYEGNIRVYTEKHHGDLHLIIADSGPGLPSYLISWLNGARGNSRLNVASGDVNQENAFAVDAAEVDASSLDAIEKTMRLSEEYNGLGLLIVKEIASMLGMGIFVENINGARVHLIFKKEMSHR